MDLETFSELDPQDISLYYQDTYVRFRGTGKSNDWEWYLVRACNPDRSMEIEDNARHRHLVVPSKEIGEMDFNTPESGLYPFKGSVIYVQKIPRRQNRKAVCGETYNFTHFSKVFKDTSLWDVTPKFFFSLSVNNLNRLFETEKYSPSLKSAWVAVKKDSLCEPTDLNFCVSAGIYGDSPVLWYRFVPVAEMKTPKLIIVNNKLFYQEVVDRFLLKEDVQIYLKD